MAAPDKVEIKRFPKGADVNVKREFARTLVKALDDMMVPPEVSFVVTTPEYMERVEEGHDEAKEAKAEAEARMEDAEGSLEAVQDLVADFGRGLLDKSELLEKVMEHGRIYT